ncbi:RED-like protein N-terminal region-domain-containing protein [Linnemannia elongata]|nr:RED-like protein N-terminal region-domain-containing protein [Linnemannia elongata]
MSNPMPPPEFKPPAEKPAEKAGGMSQDDFRKLLSTPRAAPGGQTGIKGTTSRAPVPQTPRSSEGGSNKHKHKKPSQKNPNKEASSATSKYRDRATERRQGINPDYVETEQILTTLEEAATDVAPEVIYEQSKFLGGDREHTHLVKGLDYALLKKVRQEEMDEAPEADLDEVFETVEKSVAKAEASTTEQLPEEKPEMSSALAGNIYRYAIEESGRKPPKVNEMFIPGRTVFIFEVPITKKSKKSKDGVVEDNNPFVVPTTVVRSKVDVELHQAGEVENPEADMVMKKVMHVLTAIRTGERKVGDHEAELKAKRKAAAAAAAKEAAQKLQDEEILPMVEPDVDGEDIFADVGRDYVLEPAYGDETSAPQNAMDADEVSTSMRNESREAPASKYAPPTAPKYTTPLNEKALSGRKPRLDDLEVDEDADYYSAYGLGMGGRSYTGTAYDSDDEEDEGQSTILIDKGTHKNKRAQLGRFDFDTEEGFNRYKDTVEVIPKTSFQYGVKMSEGRKTGSWDDGKGKGLSKDEKLDRDWQRISRLMEKNSGASGGGNQKSRSRPDDGSSGGGGGGGDNRSKRRKNR